MNSSISSRGEKKPRMGLGASRRGGGSAHSDRAEPSRRRRSSIRRTISSFLLCGASSRVKEDCPAQLLVTSAEIGDGERLKGKRKGSHLSLGTLADNSADSVSCRNEIPALQTVPGNLDELKLSSEIESGKVISCSSCDGDDARASFMVEPSPDYVSATETGNLDSAKSVNSITSSSSQIFELCNLNHIPSPCFGQSSSLDEVSVGNSFAEAIDSHSDNSPSYFPDSPIAFHLMHGDNLREMMPSAAEFILLESEQNRQERSLLRGDLLGDSSNILSTSSIEINGHDIRNHRRSISLSRNYVVSTDESDYSRSPEGSHRDLSDSLQGSFASLGSGSSNELGWNSRSEFWERLRGRLDTTDTPPNGCPRTHAGSSAEESVSHAISRMVVLAQTLFEVLNQIHQQPMSASSPMASLPAPESVVDMLPVKIHIKETILECAEETSQCHICLAAYDEGDVIRVLPCQHEFHMLCVDKWLKDIHGVCPLCRGDVRKGVGEASCPNLDILPH